MAQHGSRPQYRTAAAADKADPRPSTPGARAGPATASRWAAHVALAPPSGYLRPMTLNELLATPGVTSQQVQAHLASLSGEERVRQATALDRRHHHTLWELSASTEPLRLDEVVPPDRRPLDPVPFEGQNSQPIYRPFKKVFFRTGDGRIGGYNDSPAAWFAGPGYYLLKADASGVYVDYTEVPADKPAGWPPIKPNTAGFSRFVYGHMKDYLRRVYGRVVIGRAFRHGKATPNYFVLARPEV